MALNPKTRRLILSLGRKRITLRAAAGIAGVSHETVRLVWTQAGLRPKVKVSVQWR